VPGGVASRVARRHQRQRPGKQDLDCGSLRPKTDGHKLVEGARGGQMLTNSHDQVKELCFRDPAFGFQLVRLSTELMLDNINRLRGSSPECARPRCPKPHSIIAAHLGISEKRVAQAAHGRG